MISTSAAAVDFARVDWPELLRAECAGACNLCHQLDDIQLLPGGHAAQAGGTWLPVDAQLLSHGKTLGPDSVPLTT